MIRPRQTPTPTDDDPLLTVREVAERLRISERTARAWLAAGRLERVRLSARAIRVRESSLAALLAGER